MGARRQPLMFIITTAGADIEGPCYDKRRQVIEMLEGTVPDEELFGWIWTLDEGDDWTDPKMLAKANPNHGVSVFQEYLESQQARAIRSARFTNTFKTKHLNLWVSAKSGFFNMESWKACEDTTLTLEQFEGQEWIAGFDLARKLDMNSRARLFWRAIDGKTHYYSVAPKFWVPEDTAFNSDNKRMSERFQAWINSRHLDVTEGAEIDYREILEDTKEANHQAPIRECPIDPHGATGLSHDLDDEGFTPITITQNYTNMSDPMKELEAAIEAGRFHHDGKPISLSAQDTQFIESKKLTSAQICGLFRVPPHLVGSMEQMTLNNIEHMGMSFVNYSLVPLMTRIEHRVSVGLLNEKDRLTHYAKFNAGALMRGDLKGRYASSVQPDHRRHSGLQASGGSRRRGFRLGW